MDLTALIKDRVGRQVLRVILYPWPTMYNDGEHCRNARDDLLTDNVRAAEPERREARLESGPGVSCQVGQAAH